MALTISKVLEGCTHRPRLWVEWFTTTVGGSWWTLQHLRQYIEHAKLELPEVYYGGGFWSMRRCARALYWLRQAWPTVEFRVITRDYGLEQELDVDGLVGRYSWEERWHLQPPPL